MAQRVITPLQSLMRATQRLSRGEYDTPMEHTRRQDEIGRLARSFDRMRVDIGAQQKEIMRLAYWDRLTGLPNRERFRETLVQALAPGVDSSALRAGRSEATGALPRTLARVEPTMTPSALGAR